MPVLRFMCSSRGWFAFGSSEQDKMKVSQEPAEQLRCRFGLCDLWRHGDSIITSPDGRLSAITDSLGRIFLIENSTGIARRLWKGCKLNNYKNDPSLSSYSTVISLQDIGKPSADFWKSKKTWKSQNRRE